MDEYIQSVLEHLDITPADVTIHPEVLPGLTNTSRLITIKGRDYVFRRGTRAAEVLRINRDAEYAALVECNELCGELLYYNRENGDMIRQYIKGEAVANDKIAAPELMDGVIAALKVIHSKTTGFSFTPFEDIRVRTRYCEQNGIPLPSFMPEILLKTDEAERRLKRDIDRFWGLCHGDPFGCNFIMKESGELVLIDYEFSGMGDIRFDLACLVWAYPAELKHEFLRRYAGYCDEALLDSIKDSLFTVMLWNALWAAVKLNDGDCYKDIMDGLFSGIKTWLEQWDGITI